MTIDEIPASRGTAIVVLGMHRSGTSILARALHARGCALSSDLLGANPSNPSGHWESKVAIDINDQLLQSLGRTWDDPRELPQDWMNFPDAKEARRRIRIMLNGDFKRTKLWAIKEPRMCRLAPLWIDEIARLGFGVKVVLAVRHPYEVALSLLRRDGLLTAQGLMLWARHLLEAEAATRNLPRLVIEHGEITNDWRSVTRRIGERFDLEWPVSEDAAGMLLDGVISPGNINIDKAVSNDGIDAGSVPGVCLELYRCAIDASVDANAWSRFSALSERFAEYSMLYDPIMDFLSRSAATLGREASEAAALQTKEAHAEVLRTLAEKLDATSTLKMQGDRLLEMDDRLSRKSARAEDLERWLGEKEDRIRVMDNELADRGKRIHGLGAEIANKEARIHGLENELSTQLALTQELSDRLSEKQGRIHGLGTEIANKETKIHGLENELSTQLALTQEISGRLNERQDHIRLLDDELAARVGLIHRMESIVAEKEASLHNMKTILDGASKRVAELAVSLEEQDRRAGELDDELSRMRQSRSWRLTSPLRGVEFHLRRCARFTINSFKAVGFFITNPGEVRPIVSRARQEGVSGTVQRAVAFAGRGGPRDQVELAAAPQLVLRSDQSAPVVVLTTPHCLYIGHLMVNALQRAGIPAKIIQGEPESGYDDVPHFVICPQMFKRLPGMYVAFQMEQSVSSRWFTDDYITMLQNSFTIFDYSIENIDYLAGRGVSRKQIYYLPVDYLENYAVEPAPDEDYDVVFYGDVNCARRREFLDALNARFKVKIISEVFGEALKAELARARVVVNIHYYPGALLETTRIWECLSLGRMVVSEASVDMDRHPELEGMVDFVGIGDIQAMVDRVGYWLEHEAARRERLGINKAHLLGRANRFDYFFHRFLLATDNISFDDFWALSGSRLELPVDRVCLNLPEYSQRAEDFQKDNQFGFWCFPGLRHSQGWLGCAMSYKLMIMLARQQGMSTINICEDDVDFSEGFEQKLQKVHAYLSELGDDWDVFSGLMADFNPKAHISAVVDSDGLRYVHTDKLISTVFNVYSSNVFDVVARWDESNLEVKSNTIDRYLEGQNRLRVVTTDPFLVGHKEDHHSTIWGFKNTQYSDLISASNQMLSGKVDKFMSGAA